MHRSIALVIATTALLLAATPTAAAGAPSRIDLPDGWAPEGITAGRGLTAYVGSLVDGAIARVDLRTGVVDAGFVAGAAGRVAVGVEYEKGRDRLWVAGGPTGEVRAYDAATGMLLETYAFSAGFVNDLVATHDAIYATDSAMQQLLVVPLASDGSLADPSAAFSLDITGDFVYEPGFNANGIVAFAGWLIVPQSNTGELFAIDPATGESVELLPAGSITFADGLELVGGTLYVVRNQLEQVDAYRFRGATLTFVGTIVDDELDVPTTAAFAAGRLWAVNARFGTPVTEDTAYWITSLPMR